MLNKEENMDIHINNKKENINSTNNNHRRQKPNSEQCKINN